VYGEDYPDPLAKEILGNTEVAYCDDGEEEAG
jgi:hypothetical protein